MEVINSIFTLLFTTSFELENDYTLEAEGNIQNLSKDVFTGVESGVN